MSSAYLTLPELMKTTKGLNPNLIIHSYLMDHLDKLIERISSTAGDLVPLPALAALSHVTQAPLASVHPLQGLLQHLTSTKVHDTYFPFIRFGAMHAARVAAAWATMTKTRTGDVGVLQDLLGFLTVAWGGGTMAALLTATPPAWLLSPTPWVVYTAIYAALVQSGMASFIVSTAPTLPLNLALSAVDGMCRGVTITAMPVLASKSSVSAGGWWASAILGAIATNGGGWIAQAVGMNKASWTIERPAILDGGILGTLDVWGAMLCGVIYASLTRAYPPLNRVGDWVGALIPDELHDASVKAKSTGAVVSPDTARAIAVLVLGCLFAARTITTQAIAWRRAPKVAEKKAEAKVKTSPPKVVKSPAEATPNASPKPKKRKARKSKSPTP